jgi:hypothetical protein
MPAVRCSAGRREIACLPQQVEQVAQEPSWAAIRIVQPLIWLAMSFGRPLLAEVLKKLEVGPSAGQYRHLFRIYCNPVFWQGFDASPSFTR